MACLQDTKCVFGWNSDTVVIAFRGTASLANVKADIQVGGRGGGQVCVLWLLGDSHPVN